MSRGRKKIEAEIEADARYHAAGAETRDVSLSVCV